MKVVLAALLPLIAVCTACSPGDEFRPAPEALSADQARGDAIAVVLQEFGFDAARASGRSGSIDFAIRNGGQQQHEFVVVPFEDGRYGPILGEVEALEPGEGGLLRISLAPGRYKLVCLLLSETHERPTSHLDLGMSLDFEVTS
ncbi:MAG: hypothetical protein ACKVT1_13580 [Dehalococcoidia bacterium]